MQIQIPYRSASLLKMPDKAPPKRKLTDVMTSKRTESGKVILGYSGGILMQTEGIYWGSSKKERTFILQLLFHKFTVLRKNS
jgi:hypothetical protein